MPLPPLAPRPLLAKILPFARIWLLGSLAASTGFVLTTLILAGGLQARTLAWLSLLALPCSVFTLALIGLLYALLRLCGFRRYNYLLALLIGLPGLWLSIAACMLLFGVPLRLLIGVPARPDILSHFFWFGALLNTPNFIVTVPAVIAFWCAEANEHIRPAPRKPAA